MPLITNRYVFSREEMCAIQEVVSRGFSYRDWGCESLEAIRSSIRRFYRNAQQGLCPYCAKSISLQAAGNAHVEHILPKSLFPNFIFESKNLCVICADCNTAKNNGNVFNEDEQDTCKGAAKVYPRSSLRFKIVHPHIDQYTDHIVKAGIFYIDKSVKGHFTIGICKLNMATHRFGHEEAVLDDFDFFRLMQKFQTGTEAEQREVFDKIRALIPRPGV
ncbi:HNH endonuclease domain-containing protein [Pseudomonas sp. NyZ704]|nr:HNH endonuclease domain-containing protein [Pseudomonas sp. NyZ704]